jgi:electron transport complex protein RnfC
MMKDTEVIIQQLRDKKLGSFPGGVHPEGKKALSNVNPIVTLPLPERLYIPLKQHIGEEGSILVEAGQTVLKGEALTKTVNAYSVPVHAPSSGVIESIGLHPSAHPSGLPEPTIVLKTDGLDEWSTLSPHPDYEKLPAENLVEIIADAGISGMGGAGFPTHIKTNASKNIELLIINGIECEPYITSDDRLMREHAWQIRQGVDILRCILTPKHTIIAVEDNKPEALSALSIAFKDASHCTLSTIPTVYPAGGEKQLVQVLTGQEIPSKGLPSDLGISMFNVGTCYAVADAVCNGKPLIERVVTLTGEAAKQPKNVWALLGTPAEYLCNAADWQPSKRLGAKVIMGGPMMGFTLTSMQVPVVKTTNCLLMPNANTAFPGNNERPCIRCSACAEVCPASLLPQQLYWHAKGKEYEKAQDYNLFDCIECGACAYVCPSDIPLVQYYRQTKAAIRNEQDEKNKADKAKLRFEARKARLEEEKQAREAKFKKAAEAREAAKKQSQSSSDAQAVPEKPKSAAVAAAIARAKAKKLRESQQNSNTENTKNTE